MHNQAPKVRERVPTGRRGRPSKSMIAAALERPFCSYLHKICLNNRLEGHKYCIDHIMNDKTAPYRQCTYVHSVTGRRCPRAAHKVDRRASPLCQLHRAMKVNLPPPPAIPIEETSVLDELSHHDKSQAGEHVKQNLNTFWLKKEDGSAVPSIKLSKALARYHAQRYAAASSVVGGSDQVQPVEMPSMEEIAARHNNADSDTESVDNNQDVFRHAAVFTEEELTRTLRDKMIKLRRLYIEQYGHIQYILKEKRLKYIQAQRLEDEIYGELYSFRNYRDSKDYAKLRAMLRYHKTFGPESLLQEQAKKIKMSRSPTVGPHPHPHARGCHNASSTTTAASTNSTVTNTATTTSAFTTDTITTASATTTTATNTTTTASVTDTVNIKKEVTDQVGSVLNEANKSTNAEVGPHLNHQTPSAQPQPNGTDGICIFSKNVFGCDKPCLPLSPYCKQHILYDPKQVLFRPCAGGIPSQGLNSYCLTPVVSFEKKNKCWLHTAIS